MGDIIILVMVASPCQISGNVQMNSFIITVTVPHSPLAHSLVHVLSACSIFINNASLWKTLQATLLFYLMYVCVFIYRNDSSLMTIYKYEKNNKTRCPRFHA